jgi:hypothetical protein
MEVCAWDRISSRGGRAGLYGEGGSSEYCNMLKHKGMPDGVRIGQVGPVFACYTSYLIAASCDWYNSSWAFKLISTREASSNLLPFISHNIFSRPQSPRETSSMPRGTNPRGMLPVPQTCHPQFRQHLTGDSQPEGQPKFSDSSGPLFNMYREIAEEEDKRMGER